MNFATTTIRAIPLAVALGLAALTSVSLASPLGDPPSIKVRYDDLNLTNQAGLEALYHRIRSAARDVCDVSESRATLPGYSAWQKCFQAAVTDAVSKVDNRQLTALHQEATHRYG